jgi:hypothetical protein
MVSDQSTPVSAFTGERRIRERRATPPVATRVDTRLEPGVTRVELGPRIAQVSWSGVWGGFLIAVGIFMVLCMLIGAIGLSMIGTGQTVTRTGANMAGWVYLCGLVALFFGGACGTRLAMVLDDATAWLEATLIWTMALVVVTLLATGVAAGAANVARGVVQSNPTIVNGGMMRAAGWIAFAGTILAWIVTVAGSFWGRAQARDRARSLRLAA